MDWIEASPVLPGFAAPGAELRHPRAIPDHVRRTGLLTAAEEMFLTCGYAGTTMSNIARTAGMSKKTIYQVFDSKTELFRALLLDRLAVPDPILSVEALAPEAALEALLRHMARHVLAPNHVALCRLVLASAGKLPEVSGIFKDHCLRHEENLEAWLGAQSARGVFRLTDLAEAVSMLVSLAIGGFHWRLLAEIGVPPTEAMVATRIRSAIAIFMREFGTEPHSFA
jgi:AcrR family transcriptional regulator